MIEGLKPYPECKESGLPWLDVIPKHWQTARNGTSSSSETTRVIQIFPCLKCRSGQVFEFENSAHPSASK